MHFGFAAVAPLRVSTKLYAALCGTQWERFTCLVVCDAEEHCQQQQRVKQTARLRATCPYQGEKRAIDIEISFGSRGPHARQALHGSFRADVGVR